ncbi:MAG TPA: biotin/lipoyl-containing protein [Ktedonobacterales bacterium]
MASDENKPDENKPDENKPERPEDANSSAPRHVNQVEHREHLEQPSLVSRVKALAEALEGSDVSELDLTEDGARILIRRQLDAPVVTPRGAGVPRARSQPAKRPQIESTPPAGPIPEGVAIVAPLTGVFYTSASPSSPPYAAVGEPVQAGQVVCIVEAMKVFNDIKSEVSGTVTTIIAENGQLVHKGQALMRVKAL